MGSLFHSSNLNIADIRRTGSFGGMPAPALAGTLSQRTLDLCRHVPRILQAMHLNIFVRWFWASAGDGSAEQRDMRMHEPEHVCPTGPLVRRPVLNTSTSSCTKIGVACELPNRRHCPRYTQPQLWSALAQRPSSSPNGRPNGWALDDHHRWMPTAQQHSTAWY